MGTVAAPRLVGSRKAAARLDVSLDTLRQYVADGVLPEGLAWGDVDLAAGLIRVERAYDEKARVFTETKNRERRTTPIPGVLRDYLLDYKLRTGREDGLVFGSIAEQPFAASNIWRRSRTAWRRANERLADQPEADLLAPINLHECTPPTSRSCTRPDSASSGSATTLDTRART